MMETSVHKLVQARLRGRARNVCKIALVQLLIRLLWIAPLFLPLSWSVRVLWLIVCALFLILPMRFRTACQLRNITGDGTLKAAPYFSRVLGSALRFLLGGLWGVPLGSMLYLIYRYIFVLDASRYAQDAALLGGKIAVYADAASQQMIGLMLFAIAFSLCLALFLYGWRRHILYEFLLIGDASLVSTFTKARNLKKQCRTALTKTMAVNLFTLLPTLLLSLLFYCLRCGGVQNMLMSLFLLISNGLILDRAALWIALALFVCLYLPFIPYRKGRYAAIVNAYES